MCFWLFGRVIVAWRNKYAHQNKLSIQTTWLVLCWLRGPQVNLQIQAKHCYHCYQAPGNNHYTSSVFSLMSDGPEKGINARIICTCHIVAYCIVCLTWFMWFEYSAIGCHIRSHGYLYLISVVRLLFLVLTAYEGVRKGNFAQWG